MAISVQCRVLKVSVARYYEHFVRKEAASQRRHLSVGALLVHIKEIYDEVHGNHAWPRVWRELLARGITGGQRAGSKAYAVYPSGEVILLRGGVEAAHRAVWRSAGPYTGTLGLWEAC